MRRELLVALGLALATAVVYAEVGQHGFIEFDDDRYVYANPVVRQGLSSDGLRWSFRTTTASNWHPLTWISHMLDVELFGVAPGPHHWVNVGLHVLNSVLLFLLLRCMTGALWRSAAAAAFFALHPLHVESVAWISERKDLLSTFFWWLSLWIYVGHARTPTALRRLAVLGTMGFALLCKSMPVTLPFTLLLLDYWPLRRLEAGLRGLARRVVEKLPHLLLSLGAAVVALRTQEHALSSLAQYPLSVRLGNALTSYVSYAVHLFWPHPLAAYYPHPTELDVPRALGAVLLLGAVSVGAVRLRRGHPYLLWGWLWYLGTLVPVIGIVQVGAQSMADRYTYVPLVGLLVVLVWGASAALARHRERLPVLGVAVLLVCGLLTHRQVGYWRDTETLFRHTLSVTERNPVAHGILGTALSARGEVDEAIQHLRRAVELRPDLARAHNNLGNALFRSGRVEEAIPHYEEAIRLSPGRPSTYNNLGSALLRAGRPSEAIERLREALELAPDLPEAHNNLASALDAAGRVDEAIAEYREALALRPDDVPTLNNLAATLFEVGRLDEAIVRFRAALELRPGYTRARKNLALALLRSGRRSEAARELERLLAERPDDPVLRELLAQARSAR